MISFENRRMEVEDSSGDQCKELKGIYKLLLGYVGDLHTFTNKYQYTDQQIIPFWEVDSQACV